MLAHSFFFYFFSIIAIFSALMVITSRNTVNSVFFLILDFISVGCLFIMVGAEFLGMILLIVYVGAVAVLFLFVVMMLNVSEQKQSWFIGQKSTHIPSGLIVSVLIFLELLVVTGGWKYKENIMTSNTLMVNNMVGISKEEMIKRRIMPALQDSAELCSADIVMVLKDSGMHWVTNSWQLTNILKDSI